MNWLLAAVQETHQTVCESCHPASADMAGHVVRGRTAAPHASRSCCGRIGTRCRLLTVNDGLGLRRPHLPDCRLGDEVPAFELLLNHRIGERLALRQLLQDSQGL